MNKRKRIATVVVILVCLLMTVGAFFAKDFVLYDFEMEVSEYNYVASNQEKPRQAETDIWFSFGQGGLELQYGLTNQVSQDDISYYALTVEQVRPVTAADMSTMQPDFLGHFIASLPALFTRFGPEFVTRNIYYAVVFLVSLIVCILLFGRILCGFLCPAGLLQDVMDKLRHTLHIKPITVTERMNKFLQPIKWLWILLFLSFAFIGAIFVISVHLDI